MSAYHIEKFANVILANGGKDLEYPHLTPSQEESIRLRELPLSDINDHVHIAKEDRIEPYRIRRRKKYA